MARRLGYLLLVGGALWIAWSVGALMRMNRQRAVERERVIRLLGNWHRGIAETLPPAQQDAWERDSRDAGPQLLRCCTVEQRDMAGVTP